MPRAAFLVDRMFSWCGLSGKSFIPMLSSFACAVPGIMATRTIEDRKLRIITAMVAPLMTCSARLPVYAIMIAAFVPYESYFGVFNLQGLVLGSLYLLGVVVAVIVSFIFSRTLFKTERGTFLMELPSYKLPTIQSVAIRVTNRAKAFIVRAGTVIMAITIIIWALSYYPRSDEITQAGELREAQITAQYEAGAFASEEAYESAIAEAANVTAGEHLRNSYFARTGQSIEGMFEPLGWDWKITMSVLASFPAREVIIAVLGTIYNLGSEVDEESSSLIDKLRDAKWEDGALVGQPVFTPAVAISIMVFFALCCQCGATLVTIRQETASWKYAVLTFAYMTSLAYLLAFGSYRLMNLVWT
jgi:ferrous iron transport protein B